MDGFSSVLTPENLLYAAIGVLLGTFVGVLPGIGPAMAVALLLPVTYGLEPTPAFIMFAGIYYGGMYGGSTTSILLNTPGESASVMTALEGNMMARGRTSRAGARHRGDRLLHRRHDRHAARRVLRPGARRSVAVEIGAPSYFALMVLAMVMVTSVLGGSPLRGFIALFLGLTIGLVGLDLNTGQSRLSFDQPLLADRIDIVVVAVGIFALGEALWVAAHLRRSPAHVIPVGRPWMSRSDLKRSWGPWLRGTAYGFPFGALPAGGAEIPTFLSYITEKRIAARKGHDEFGKGAIEGVAGPEAANNASAAGTFVPLLALGLPVTATSAVMLAALQGYGIEPGPGLMTDQPELVWALLASLLIGNVLLLVLNLPLAPLWAKLLRIPRPQLYAGILFFAALGAYAANLQAFDLFLLLLLGLLGLMMRRFALPVLPLILGVILGPLMEFRLREAMAISGGDVSALWSEPLAIVIYVIVSIAVVAPFAVRRLRPTPAAVAADQSMTTDDTQTEEKVR